MGINKRKKVMLYGERTDTAKNGNKESISMDRYRRGCLRHNTFYYQYLRGYLPGGRGFLPCLPHCRNTSCNPGGLYLLAIDRFWQFIIVWVYKSAIGDCMAWAYAEEGANLP